MTFAPHAHAGSALGYSILLVDSSSLYSGESIMCSLYLLEHGIRLSRFYRLYIALPKLNNKDMY